MNIEWKTPVVDRRQADIENKTSKAYLNAGDLNRIEGNIRYINETLNRFLFPIQIRSKKWKKCKIPTTADIERICGNIGQITVKYYEPEGFRNISGIPVKPLDYQDVNDLEMNLLLIKKLLDLMEAGFIKAAFKSGKNFILPKRRM